MKVSRCKVGCPSNRQSAQGSRNSLCCCWKDGKSAGPTHLQMPVAPPCQPIRSLGWSSAAGPHMRRHWGRVVESGRITPKWPQSASTMTNLADLPSYGGTNTASFAASTFASDTLPARESCKRFPKGSAFRPGGRRCCRLIAASRPGAT
jgi:hypothetical protein